MTKTHIKGPHDGDFIYWFGKNLAAAGLLKNEPWVLQHAKEAYQIGEFQSLGWILSCMSISHFRAIDYIRQAPLLGAGGWFRYMERAGTEHLRYFDSRTSNQGQLLCNKEGYLGLARDMAMICKHKYNLREAYRFFNLSPSLRYIPVESVTSSHIIALNYLSSVNPSTIAQCIPSCPRETKIWLNYLSIWITQVTRGVRQPRHDPYRTDLGLSWLIKSLEKTHSAWTQHEVSDLADFYAAVTNWNDSWSWRTAIRKQHEWHEHLASEDALRKVDADRLIPYNDLPLLTELEGHTIEALNTYRKQHVEGAVQKHCLGSYGQRMHNSFFFSLKDSDGKRVSTFEISSVYGSFKRAYVLVQHKAYRNACPSRTADTLVHKFLAQVNRPK